MYLVLARFSVTNPCGPFGDSVMIFALVSYPAKLCGSYIGQRSTALRDVTQVWESVFKGVAKGEREQAPPRPEGRLAVLCDPDQASDSFAGKRKQVNQELR